MTITEVTAAVCGYTEKECDLLFFIKRNIWDAARLSVFEQLKVLPQCEKLKKPIQIWKFEWDGKIDVDMDKINERLRKADTIFPKIFPKNLK